MIVRTLEDGKVVEGLKWTQHKGTYTITDHGGEPVHADMRALTCSVYQPTAATSACDRKPPTDNALRCA